MMFHSHNEAFDTLVKASLKVLQEDQKMKYFVVRVKQDGEEIKSSPFDNQVLAENHYHTVVKEEQTKPTTEAAQMVRLIKEKASD